MAQSRPRAYGDCDCDYNYGICEPLERDTVTRCGCDPQCRVQPACGADDHCDSWCPVGVDPDCY